jgi:CHASE3 domain sensor protein
MQAAMVRKSCKAWLAPRSLLRVLPLGIVLFAGGTLSIWSNRVLRNHRDLVVHTHEVIEAGKDLLLAITSAETSQRGYVITSDSRYLAPYAGDQAAATAMVAKLGGLVADNPDQGRRLARLPGLLHTKLGELDEVISAHDGTGFEAARGLVLADTGRATMEVIRSVVAETDATETELLAARTAEVRVDERRVLMMGALAALASV